MTPENVLKRDGVHPERRAHGEEQPRLEGIPEGDRQPQKRRTLSGRRPGSVSSNSISSLFFWSCK